MATSTAAAWRRRRSRRSCLSRCRTSRFRRTEEESAVRGPRSAGDHPTPYTPPTMTLRELMGNGPDVEVSSLAYRSSSVTPGTLFFCVRGFTSDGHDFAPDAVQRGAVALVCERPLGLGVPEVIVPDARAAMPAVAARFFGEPTTELRVMGITGTNGKTTTAFLVRALLEAA